MNDRRPVRILLALVATAVVSAMGSGLLDVQGDWGEPRQAAANILWIVFLVSVLGIIVAAARMLMHRRTTAAQ
jgi:amino acid transporter